ncbi:MAG: NADH-quinone oxidoreductase subunit M, partial [Hymenobacter sp.]
MLTAFLVFFPLAAALLLHFAKGAAARALALGAALLEFAVAVFAAFAYVHNGPAGFDLNLSWIPSAGINFHLGIDGLSLVLVLLTTVLVPIILLTAFRHEEYDNPGAFYALVLFMQTGLLGVFTAMDAFVFYFFWEVALIPIYFLAGAWSRADRRIQITFKFFLYTIIGSLFMLAGFVYLYLQTGPAAGSLAAHSSDIQAFYNLKLDASVQAWLFWLIFAAFAVKMPIFP